MQILKVVMIIVTPVAALTMWVAHEVGAYIDDVYNHEDFWP